MLEATPFGRDTCPAWWHKSMKSMALTTVSKSSSIHLARIPENENSHLSKWLSDLKINDTQENVTFSDRAFHGLPCGVLFFCCEC